MPQDQRLGMYLLASVTESLGDTLREHYPTLQSILARALRPSATVDEEVCLHAMRATGAVITWLSSKEEIVCTYKWHGYRSNAIYYEGIISPAYPDDC